MAWTSVRATKLNSLDDANQQVILRLLRMKTLLLAIFMFAFAAAGNAQADDKYLIKVKGVGLGTDHSDVITRLGKPKTDTNDEGDECRGSRIRTLVYDGLELELSESLEPAAKFYVYSIEITNDKWKPFGLKTGAAQAAVKLKMGRATSEETDSETGEAIWYYSFDNESDGPGTTNFYFKAGKLVRIFSMYMC